MTFEMILAKSEESVLNLHRILDFKRATPSVVL